MPSGTPIRIQIAGCSSESGAGDAFGRQRVSQPVAHLESKLLFDKQPLIWNEVLANGATSVHSTADSSVTMTVGGGTESAVRTTKISANYQPGRSQLILMTGNLNGHVANVTKRIGYFNDNDGLFFESDGTTLRVVVRKGGSDTAVAQTDWNHDKLDGTGPSGIILDPTKAQLFSIDFEWLSVGRVRFSFYFHGLPILVHEVLHANLATSSYMASPNLPLRYQITSTGGSSSLVQLCSVTLSEGAPDDLGIIRSASTDGTQVDANVIGTVYAVVGIRLKTTHLTAVVKLEDMSMISETNDDFEWLIVLNPTVAGTFTYGDETDSAVQTARGATANTVTSGTRVGGGFAKSNIALNLPTQSTLQLGTQADGTVDEFVLCVRPLSSNADIQGSLTWRELL